MVAEIGSERVTKMDSDDDGSVDLDKFTCQDNWGTCRALDKQGLWKNPSWDVLLAELLLAGSEIAQWTTIKSTVEKYASQRICNWEVKNTENSAIGPLIVLIGPKLYASDTDR